MNIMFTTYGTHILVDVVIVDLIHVNLILWIAFYRGVAMMISTQAKIMSYHN
jgi:hypothetical protein